MTDFLNDELPLVEIGTWTMDEAEQIVVTLTGQTDRTYDESVTKLLTWQDSVLTEADTQAGQIVEAWIEISALATGQQPVPYNPADLDRRLAENGFIGIYKSLPTCGLLLWARYYSLAGDRSDGPAHYGLSQRRAGSG